MVGWRGWVRPDLGHGLAQGETATAAILVTTFEEGCADHVWWVGCLISSVWWPFALPFWLGHFLQCLEDFGAAALATMLGWLLGVLDRYRALQTGESQILFGSSMCVTM